MQINATTALYQAAKDIKPRISRPKHLLLSHREVSL